MDFLKGKRTILTGVAMILYAATSLLLGHMDTNSAVEMLLEGVGLVSIRLGLVKEK